MTFLSLFTPTNIEVEREKFFDSSSYNPVFTYKRDLEDFNIYISKHPSKKTFAEALWSGNSETITEAAKKYFVSDIDATILKEASSIVDEGYRLFDISGNDSQKLFDGMSEALKFFEIDYKVVIKDARGFNVRPNHRFETVLISKYAELGLFSLDTSIKHEITHVIRYVNKLHNESLRSKNHLSTEEGLASYIGDYHAEGGFNSKFHHAAEYLATEISLKGSLRDVFNYFVNLKYPKEFSWQRAIRHKFGFINTQEPGDIMKPSMYFYYENKVSKLSGNDILKLFSGKISLDDLNMIDDYSGVIPKDKLVKYFNLQV
ncbi:MAG: hypothetical protein ACMG57_05630 [Candidatus Dojkabacteria bacterium]